ncbi:MAG: acetyl-CoA carboxylase carboxyltransferase subunit alpha [Chlamydiales bacterium]|nr:acetyl-CoA carboxylase carboxyltransferase subunit alpha [Chlamydiales bacterium]
MLEHEKQIHECEEAIAKLKEQNNRNDGFAGEELSLLTLKLNELKAKVYAELTPWQRVAISRHPDRPHTIDYIQHVCDEFIELCGDRAFGNDPAIIGGLGLIGKERFMIIGQEKGNDTESRIKRNFGMPHPEGYRKALRLMEIAEKFHLPVLSFVDTPGAYPGLAAEERGQGMAIAKNLYEMSQLQTPIIVLLIGEGCSGGALGMGIGDAIAMLEHSYYSVISPEGCASILWKDASKNEQAASSLKLLPEDLKKINVIDDIIAEPLGGAHHNKQQVFQDVRNYILQKWEELKETDIPTLLNNRYEKFRRIGAFIDQSTQN